MREIDRIYDDYFKRDQERERIHDRERDHERGREHFALLPVAK